MGGQLKVEEEEEGERDPGPVLPGVVQAVCLQEEDERSRVHGWDEAALHHSGVLTVSSDPPNGFTDSTTSLSLVNEQPAHPAELAGKPPPEGTKVFVMELLKFGGLADIT